MSTWKAVVTEKGEALLAKMTQGSVLEITHAEIGAGTVDITEDTSLLKQQTSVSTVKQTATVEPVGYPEEGMCALPVTITNEGVTAGYAAWQIGVFANDPDEGKVLFFIAQAEDTATNIPSATLMPSYNTQIIFYVEYGAADSVTVDVNPANTVSQAGMENYVAGQIAGITADALGLGNVDNTSDNEKNVAFAQEAGEARKLQNSMTIRFNGGRTENTDMWSFDGSVDRSLNITPESIGAAEAEHTHTPKDIGAEAAVEDSTYPGCYYRSVNAITEWINPPLIDRQWYVTTKRFQGKPVRVFYRDLQLSDTSAGTQTLARFPTSLDKVVSFDIKYEKDGVLYDYTMHEAGISVSFEMGTDGVLVCKGTWPQGKVLNTLHCYFELTQTEY